MKEVQRLFTPPEWPTWRWPAKLGFVVVYVGLMAPVIWVARKAGAWVVTLLGG